MMTRSKKQHKKLKIQKIFLILIILPEKKELKEINSLKNFLNDFDIKKIDTKSIIHEKFQKDNHKNKHVFFINLYDNLRAKNYRIPLSNEQKTKMIAGKIVPAIANTNAMLTGFACMQLISLLNSNDISLIKNCYFDSAFNFNLIILQMLSIYRIRNIILFWMALQQLFQMVGQFGILLI